MIHCFAFLDDVFLRKPKYTFLAIFATMQKPETILFCPLNWGLGHATRIVPLIKQSIGQGHKVLIGANNAALSFLQNEFPNVESIELKGYNVRYWRKPFFVLGLLLQMPLFYFSILHEHIQIKKIVKQKKITKIISDNRYGLRSQYTKNIIITHQLFIKLPKALRALEPLLHLVTRKLLQNFHECWVPDYAEKDKSLSGELSHGKPAWDNVKYIEPLSRFQNYFVESSISKKDYPNVLIIISGPEPQRTHFEIEMTNRFLGRPEKVLMACGKPHSKAEIFIENIHKVNHLSTRDLFLNLKNCKHIVARSGYSTIMDLHVLSRKAELIPTPGQSEQEYLAEYHY